MEVYIDENITPSLVGAIRQLGDEATCCRDEKMLGRTDEEQLTFATARGYCLVTCDEADFRSLTREWQETGRTHAGIIIVPFRIAEKDVGWVARELHVIAQNYPAGPGGNAVLYVSRGAGA